MVVRWLSATMQRAIIETKCGHTVRSAKLGKTALTAPHLRDVGCLDVSRTAIHEWKCYTEGEQPTV